MALCIYITLTELAFYQHQGTTKSHKPLGRPQEEPCVITTLAYQWMTTEKICINWFTNAIQTEIWHLVCGQVYCCLEKEVKGSEWKEFGWHCILYYQTDGKLADTMPSVIKTWVSTTTSGLFKSPEENKSVNSAQLSQWIYWFWDIFCVYMWIWAVDMI